MNFWSRVGQIRHAQDQSLAFHEAQAQAVEQAVAELVDDACSPWFDERAFAGARGKIKIYDQLIAEAERAAVDLRAGLS